jgi:hypothetical protein
MLASLHGAAQDAVNRPRMEGVCERTVCRLFPDVLSRFHIFQTYLENAAMTRQVNEAPLKLSASRSIVNNPMEFRSL